MTEAARVPPTPPDWMPEARELAAQCWCDPETSDRVMDAALAEEARRALRLAECELVAFEWEGCDASAMPLCYACRREPPDYDRRGENRPEQHNADCDWLETYQAVVGVLALLDPPKEPTT